MKKKILVVEDESALQKILIDTLTRGGYTAVLAKTGTQALKMYEKEKPVLILLDIILPEISGFDVLEQIRVKFNSDIPVIIVSSLGEKEDREMGKNLHVVDYVLKSEISLKSLLLKIHQVLSK